jgi:hypothetical protein
MYRGGGEGKITWSFLESRKKASISGDGDSSAQTTWTLQLPLVNSAAPSTAIALLASGPIPIVRAKAPPISPSLSDVLTLLHPILAPLFDSYIQKVSARAMI